MRDFFKTDLAMRLVSVVAAIVIWVYVVILIEPSVDVPYSDIPVIYNNTVSLGDNFVLINEKPHTVSLKLRGSRNILSQINKSDITAYVDLNGYNQSGTFLLPILVRLPYEEVTVVEKKPFNISVTISELVTQTFPITVEVTGQPQERFMVYEAIPTISSVDITGPSEIVATIERVVANINVTGADRLVTAMSPLKFFNSNQDIVTSKHLTASADTVEVRAEILQSKSVPVKAVLSDGAGDKYTASVVTNSFVTILAEPSELASIDTLYTEPVKIQNDTESERVTAKLIIPENVHTQEDITEVIVEVVKKD
ncbi:MAG: CdaR family protein [Eubacteriales bacterium]|nr:CdaR family protein [Eubacteriales bacterium]